MGDDIPKWARDAAAPIVEAYISSEMTVDDAIARAIMAAKGDAYEASAKIAEAYIDPIDIAHYIRKRGEA